MRFRSAFLLLAMLAPTAAAQSHVEGRVALVGTDTPVRAVALSLRTRYNTDAPGPVAYSEADGRYRLAVPPGTWRLRAVYDDGARTRTLVTPPFAVPPHDTILAFGFHLDLRPATAFGGLWEAIARAPISDGIAQSGASQGYRLEGTLRHHETGEPRAADTVRVRLSLALGETRSSVQHPDRLAVTDAAGRFAFDGLAPGHYRVRANTRTFRFGLPLDLVTDTRVVFSEGASAFGAPGDPRGYVTDAEGFVLADALVSGGRRWSGTLAGTLRTPGGPLGGAVVALEGTALATRTDAAGQYRLAGFPAGTYALHIVWAGRAERIEGIAIAAGPNPLDLTVER